MLTCQIQLHKPTSCLHRIIYGRFFHGLVSEIQIEVTSAKTRSLNIVHTSRTKISENDPLIGSTRYKKSLLAEDMVAEVESGFPEEEEDAEYEEVDASFMLKNLLPSQEVEDDAYQDSKPTNTPLSTSKDMQIVNEHGMPFLEETDQDVLSNRILVLSRTNKIRSALEYFTSMEILGLCPSTHACNSLISCLLRNGQYDDGLKVFNFTRRKNLSSGHTYSLILKELAKAQGYESALKIFRKLETECDSKKDFDAILYNTMISICGKAHNWIEVERIWRSMKVNGCAGTQVTYCLLVSTFVCCGQIELALDVYHDMIQNGFEPGNDTMQAIIGACTREGKWDIALALFQKMLKGGQEPNLVTCNALINSLGKAGELRLAFQTCDVMKSLGHKPDEYTFNALLNALNKADRHHDAIKLFEEVEGDDTSQLNIHLYNTVLMSCSKLGLWDRALQILWQMEASGLPPSTVSYNLAISSCQHARKPRIALQVYDHMVHQKCGADIFTYLSLARCCIWGNLWDELEEIINLATPDATLYNTIVQGLCLRRKRKLANKFYKRMREGRFQPDGKTRALMLRYLSRRAKL